MASDGTIKIGSRVTWHEFPLDRQYTRRIVKPVAMRAEEIKTTMPANAPIARAMIGHAVGDRFTVDTPAGSKRIAIREVK